MHKKIFHLHIFLSAVSQSYRFYHQPISPSNRFLQSIAMSQKATSSIKNFFSVTSSSNSGKKRKADESGMVDENDQTKEKKVGENANSLSVLPVAASIQPSSISSVDAVADTAISQTTGWPPMDSLEPSWRERLLPEFRKPYFQRLMQFLAAESRTHTIFPPSDQVFTALNLCPFDTVKVVIIGQDPYHGPGQAHGLAFSVQKGVQLPPSLRNMVTEAQNDPAVHIPAPSHGNLECWAKQGVLMLNTVLTVRKAEANSHQKKGWEEFTDAIVRELGKKEGLVYLLWGKPAQSKCQGIDHRKNIILTSSHPSPLSAYKTSEPFIGSRIFSRCNDALQQLHKDAIDWTIR